MLSLPKILKKRPFTYGDILSAGLTKYALGQLLRQGTVERIGRGVYISSGYDDTNPEAQYYLATLQCGQPSCICLLSALDYYHVTDQIPKQIWMMVPQVKRIRTKNLKLIRTRNPNWNRGIVKTKDYCITTLSRTLVECLLYKNRIGSDVAISALKTALRDKKVKLQDVMRMANQMGVKQRIYPYIETLAA